MRIAIIAPPYPLEEAPAPPLGITYVAAAFEAAGAEVQLIDYIVSRYTPEKLRAQLEAFRPDVVGTTSVTLNFPSSAAILSTVKDIDPSITTVMGGPHVSFDAEATLLAYPNIDLIVRGEGEQTIAELVASKFDPAAFEGIAGLAFRKDGGIHMTQTRAFMEDLNALPMPARHLLPLSRYQALGFPISMITSRGCPYQCIFCQGRRMVGSRVRQRSAIAVVDEMENILSYGITRINIADDLFVSDKQKVREVCGEIRRRGLHFAWSAFARVNTVDKETLEIMRDTGCDAVSFGVESGNQEMLDRIKKKITLDQVRKAVALCREVGLVVHCSFIVGLPGETHQTLADSKAFAETLGDYYGYHLLAPFPGTTVREKVAEYDLEILTDDWTQYDANKAIVRTKALEPADIRKFADAFDDEVEEEWQKLIRGYHEGTNAPFDNLRVEGHFRTQLVFKLLSGDILEEDGRFAGYATAEDTIIPLCRRIGERTDAAAHLIEQTVRDFTAKGYIRAAKESDGSVRWHWTHNNGVAE